MAIALSLQNLVFSSTLNHHNKAQQAKQSFATTMAPMTRGGIKRKQEEIENAKFKAVNILLQNGWLSARDLCRLETTSRDFKQWILEDETWKTSCCSRFPNSECPPQAFIRSLGGYKMLYRHRTSALLVHDEGKLAPLPMPDLCG